MAEPPVARGPGGGGGGWGKDWCIVNGSSIGVVLMSCFTGGCNGDGRQQSSQGSIIYYFTVLMRGSVWGGACEDDVGGGCQKGELSAAHKATKFLPK